MTVSNIHQFNIIMNQSKYLEPPEQPCIDSMQIVFVQEQGPDLKKNGYK